MGTNVCPGRAVGRWSSCPGQWGSPHPWGGPKPVWMWPLGTGFGRHGGVGLMVGLGDLGGRQNDSGFCILALPVRSQDRCLRRARGAILGAGKGKGCLGGNIGVREGEGVLRGQYWVKGRGRGAQGAMVGSGKGYPGSDGGVRRGEGVPREQWWGSGEGKGCPWSDGGGQARGRGAQGAMVGSGKEKGCPESDGG